MARGTPLSVDIRQLIKKYVEEGKSAYYISKILKIPYSTIKCVVKNYSARGSMKCLKKIGRQSSVTLRELRIVKSIIKKNRRGCASEITAIWNKEVNSERSVSTYSRQVKRMGYGFYKVG